MFVTPQIAAVADIGGATVDGATRRMMAFLLEHKFSRGFNFLGRNGKRGFKPLKLFEVVYGRWTIQYYKYREYQSCNYRCVRVGIGHVWGS